MRSLQPALTIATAGHIDHGKTALVRALTGHDTDRLPQEKRRGMSIEPGFAPLDIPGAPPISIVDVPGHERFVRHMVAGASGVDAFLLCVAADDGVMPQTREHLLVLELLGVQRGIVAITKTDRADPIAARRHVRELLGDGLSVTEVCAPTGDGITAAKEALRQLATELVRRPSSGPSRLFVDRAFTLSGAGTVVTGTLWGAPLRSGDTLRIEPGGRRVRIRGLQVHGSAREVVEAGRVAANLAGASPEEVSRGACLVAADAEVVATGVLQARLDWRGADGGVLRTRRRLQLFLGTAETSARCRLPASCPIPAGETGAAELQLQRPVPARAGDRFVLREGARTVGGGTVTGLARRGAPAARVDSGAHSTPAVPPALLRAIGRELAERGLSGASPPRLATATGATERPIGRAVRQLIARGDAVRVGDRLVDSATLEAAVGAAREQMLARPATLADLGALWGVGRDRVVDIAEFMDARGFSQRQGNARIAGPRRFAGDS
ncbi:MAG: selenocysteine-specific translation elongation factor [Thermoleophilia bacterium]|nr:selenocysteine-specific translation elongation factor [Thermoleophilia bacterium]MDH3724302.1 selenocysteine-specific translation elongation factor [Thermoleophilia bacterium]